MPLMDKRVQPIIPEARGRVSFNAPLGALGWFKAGGNAEILFKPQDQEDLQDFLANLDPSVPVMAFGVGSNMIIRDGGVKGCVIRLGREFATIERRGDAQIYAGALALDGNVAAKSAEWGITGLEFYAGIPGSIGGAIKMNAGAHGAETKNVLVEAYGVNRQGEAVTFKPDLSYRHSNIADDFIVTGALFEGALDDPDAIHARIEDVKQQREDSQPIREKTGGSTFANPDGHKAWQLIDEAGCRGLRVGGAHMSEKHCNFMINDDDASAADLENLGEEVRKRVKDKSGIELRWEIKRIGNKEIST